MDDPGITIQTIELEEGGSWRSASYPDESEQLEIAYWVGSEHRGRGIATRALQEFLARTKVRPLYAYAAKDNGASLYVREKCGFKMCWEGAGFSPGRRKETALYLLKLGEILLPGDPVAPLATGKTGAAAPRPPA